MVPRMLDIVVTAEARMFLGSCWNMEAAGDGTEPEPELELLIIGDIAEGEEELELTLTGLAAAAANLAEVFVTDEFAGLFCCNVSFEMLWLSKLVICCFRLFWLLEFFTSFAVCFTSLGL